MTAQLLLQIEEGECFSPVEVQYTQADATQLAASDGGHRTKEL